MGNAIEQVGGENEIEGPPRGKAEGIPSAKTDAIPNLAGGGRRPSGLGEDAFLFERKGESPAGA
jgi:hypothetical protein